MNIPISSITLVSNVRNKIDTKSDEWKSFKESVNNKGILTALSVYEEDGEYYLLYGHRRLKALQELGKETAPVCVFDKPNGDLSSKQIDENLMREDLSLFDEVMAFRDMTNKWRKSVNTVQDVADKFGHNFNYVRKRLNLANLTPALLRPDVVTDDSMNSLLKFASNSKKMQNRAIEWSMKREKKTKSKVIKQHFVEGGWSTNSPYQFPDLKTNKLEYSDFVDFVDGKENLQSMEEEYGYKHPKTDTLFDEFYSEDYCNEPDFIKFACSKVSPGIYKAIYEDGIPVKKLDQYHKDVDRYSYDTLFKHKYSSKKMEQALSAVDLREAPYYITVKKRIKTEKSDTIQVERDKYYGQTKKLGRTLAKDYVDYLVLKFLAPTKSDSNNVTGSNPGILKWTFSEMTQLDDISINAYNTTGFNLESIKKVVVDKYGKENLHMRSLLGLEIVNTLIIESIYSASFKSLNKFAKIINAKTLKDWFNDQYAEGDEQFVTNVLNCFTTKNLSKISKGKKSDVVQYAVQNNSPFPFKDVFTSKESDWTDISVKYHYLDRKTLY